MPAFSANPPQTRRRFLLRLGAGIGAGALASGAAHFVFGEPAKRPNVLVILADDLGWGDIGLHGGATPTPNIDAFFKSALEMGCFTVQPVCSPTRSSLLTGRNCIRLGITPNTVNNDTGATMSGDELTLAEAFEANGYETAILGKWHLGYKPTPNEQGFELAYGNLNAAVDYFTRMHNRGYYDWQMNGKPFVEEGYTTELIRNHAVDYLKSHGGQKPFFLYVPFTAVHAPWQVTEAYIKRVPAAIQGEEQRTYSAMIIALDDAVGAILKSLDERGLASDTIVFFGSDNGAPLTIGNNLPFRGGKHSLWEGGIRTPAAIRWGNRLTTGKRTDEFLSIDDLHPTLLSLAGAKRPTESNGRPTPPLDGFDITPVLRDGAPSPREFRCWIWNDYDAIRTAQWKLLRWRDHKELYDLKADPSEAKDVIGQHPDVAKKLEEQMDAWQASVPCHPSHVPVRLSPMPEPKPEGQALEVRVKTRPNGAGQALTLILAAADKTFQLHPGDVLQYDMFVAEESAQDGFFIDVARTLPSPYVGGFFPGFFPPGIDPATVKAVKGNIDGDAEATDDEASPAAASASKADAKKKGAKAGASGEGTGEPKAEKGKAGKGETGKAPKAAKGGGKKPGAEFTRAAAVDQYGAPQGSGPGFPQARGRWATRLIGLANMCPAMINAARLNFPRAKAGDYHFYIDNVLIRRHDGSVFEIYRNGEALKPGNKLEAAGAEVSVKAVPVSQIKAPLR